MLTLAIVQFPGSNCDDDARYVLERLGQRVVMVWHRETSLKGIDAVVIPGGFSYGDYLRAGALAAQSPVMSAVKSFAEAGGPVLGICNGFQILTEAGLLPGQLARNPRLHFLCGPSYLRVERTDTPFSSSYLPGQVLKMPIAHNEGAYYADEETLRRLEGNNQVVFRYVNPEGELAPGANPNSSLNAIAGIVSDKGNVLGMMPHPERAAEAMLGSEDGVGVFKSLLSGNRS